MNISMSPNAASLLEVLLIKCFKTIFFEQFFLTNFSLMIVWSLLIALAPNALHVSNYSADSEGSGQAGEVGPCQPHEVQQSQAQGPAPGSGQSQAQID